MASSDWANYCHPNCATGLPNSTGRLEIRAVCSISKDAINAQNELAQRYRNGFIAKESTSWSSNWPDPEQSISPDQSVADYWTRFASVTQVVLLARNGDADAQLKLGHFYLDGGEAGNMIDQFQYSSDLSRKFREPNPIINYFDGSNNHIQETIPNLKLHNRSGKAYFWFKKSAEQGNVEAKEKVIELKKYLKNK